MSARCGPLEKPGAFLHSVKLDLSRVDAALSIAFAATKETGDGTETDGRIRKDAVRIALTSGLTRKQSAYDLSVGY